MLEVTYRSLVGAGLHLIQFLCVHQTISRFFTRAFCSSSAKSAVGKRFCALLTSDFETTSQPHNPPSEGRQSQTNPWPTISSPSSRSESRRTSAIPLMLAMGKTTMNKNDAKIDIDGEGRKGEEEVPACNILSIDIRLSPSSEWWGPGRGEQGMLLTGFCTWVRDNYVQVTSWVLRSWFMCFEGGPSP